MIWQVSLGDSAAKSLPSPLVLALLLKNRKKCVATGRRWCGPRGEAEPHLLTQLAESGAAERRVAQCCTAAGLLTTGQSSRRMCSLFPAFKG